MADEPRVMRGEHGAKPANGSLSNAKINFVTEYNGPSKEINRIKQQNVNANPPLFVKSSVPIQDNPSS